MDKLTERVRATIEEHALLDGVSRVICALSGGADSVCLLHVMKSLAPIYGIEVAAAHMNHSIRGEEALRDENFVRSLCDKWGIKLFCETRDIPALAAERGEGLEECGRSERYAFFDEICEARDAVATAHNAGDVAETVLFRMARGTSASGMSAIAYKRGNIIRPLLDAERRDIEKHLGEASIEYCTDSTNASLDYARNKIRHCVMPCLEEISHGAAMKIRRAAKLIGEDDALLCTLSERFAKDIFKSGKLDTAALTALPRPLSRRICARVLREWGVKSVSADKVEELFELCAQRTARRMDIDGTHLAIKMGSFVFIEKEPLSYDKNEILDEKHSIYYEFWTLQAKCVDKRPKKRDNDTAIFDFDAIALPLSVRAANSADAIALPKMDGKKRVRDIYGDQKVPIFLRGALPVVLCGDEVLFAPPFRQSTLYPVTDKTTHFLVIEYKEAGDNVL